MFDSLTSVNFSGFLFTTAKVESITATIHYIFENVAFVFLTEPRTYRNSTIRNKPSFHREDLPVHQERGEGMEWMAGLGWMVPWGTLAEMDPREKMVILGQPGLPGLQG